MSEQPINNHRPDAQATVRALTVGTIVAVAVFAVAFVLRLVGQVALAEVASSIAVVVLLATPAVALVTTAVELRRAPGLSAAFAVLVLLILAGATAVALLVSR